MSALITLNAPPQIQSVLHRSTVYRLCHIGTKDVIIYCPNGSSDFIYYGIESGDKNIRADDDLNSRADDDLLYVRHAYTQPTEIKRDVKLLEKEAHFVLRARRGIVEKPVHEYFLERKDETYLSTALELADRDLATYLTGKVPRVRVPKIVPWFGCLIGATALMHRLGMQHGAISPYNILTRNDRVFLADFGMAQKPSSGLKGYCAPEVESGNAAGQPADIFSLGAVFLEMVIAHSERGRGELEKILTARGSRSYAASIDQVEEYIGRLEKSFEPGTWYLSVLSDCRNMLHMEPTQRPLARTLRDDWVSKHPDLPACQCSDLRIIGWEDIKLRS